MSASADASGIPAGIAERYRRFIQRCKGEAGSYRLTERSDATVYAACFAVFGANLLLDKAMLAEMQGYGRVLREEIRSARRRWKSAPDDKPYRQLLAFALSALKVLDMLDQDPLEELVVEQLREDLPAMLASQGALTGKPQSGNQAMFTGVFLIHAQRFMGMDTAPKIDEWVDLHLRAMNRFGFWGQERGMTHLAFQNGYHQYEILEYLGVRSPREAETVASVRSLADAEGHFAPYPGGGGCYDYDAVFMLTPRGRVPDAETAALLRRTANTILHEQTPEGGFAESLRVRPRCAANLRRAAFHVAAARSNRSLLVERLRYNLALQRPKHDRIHTHWSVYSRGWAEANLWDSWFRMLTLARIDAALHPERASRWGFIDYPGIGFHASLRERTATTAA